jgi:nucleotide-binding universal stress UspA family protein
VAEVILVPVDGFGPAGKAVDLAGDLATKYGARIHLLHILLQDKDAVDLAQLPAAQGLDEATLGLLDSAAKAPSDPTVSAAVLAMDPKAVRHPAPDEVLHALGRKILEGAESVAKSKGVERVTQSVEKGEPVKCILAEAESQGADTIVMGHRGLETIEGVTFGSVSDQVSHLADCTVVMIK